MTHMLPRTTLRSQTLRWTPPTAAVHTRDMSGPAILARAHTDVILLKLLTAMFTDIRHHAHHHNQEHPAVSALHAAYDHRRRARRARGRRRSR